MKILLATDGSECSQVAINSLLQIPVPAGSSVHVLKVLDFYEPFPALEGLKEKEIEEAHAHVSKTVQMLESTLPSCDISGSVNDGFADSAILDEADRLKTNLIVMGAHGGKGLARFLLGSVSRAVLVSAPCSVRIVRTNLNKTDKDKFRVLVALDDSDAADHALKEVSAGEWPANTEFKCVTVVPKSFTEMLFSYKGHETGVQEHHDFVKTRAENQLHEVHERLQIKFKDNAVLSEVLHGETREEIIREAERWAADLIVMGSYGRRFLDRVMVGSISESIAVHAPCSVEVHPIPKTSPLHVII